METKKLKKNMVTLIGTLMEDPTFDHTSFKENFYKTKISVKRKSETIDEIPVKIPENVMPKGLKKGDTVKVIGLYHSYREHENGNSHLRLQVKARIVEIIKTPVDTYMNNRVHLEGTICTKPVYRKTPLGSELTDVLIAVNRPYKKSDYIPCLVWGAYATKCAEHKVGDRVIIDGRIQSREYTKKYDENHSELKTAYEVSVARIRFDE